ncbi:Hypothetical protein CINCED_3A016658, partial [Cinara cedri]
MWGLSSVHSVKLADAGPAPKSAVVSKFSAELVLRTNFAKEVPLASTNLALNFNETMYFSASSAFSVKTFGKANISLENKTLILKIVSFIYGYLKERVYRQKINSEAELRERILQATIEFAESDVRSNWEL